MGYIALGMRETKTRRWPPERLSAFERDQRIFRVLEKLCNTSFLLGLAMLFTTPIWIPSAQQDDPKLIVLFFVYLAILMLVAYLGIRFEHRKLLATAAVTQILNRRRALYDDRDCFVLLRSLWHDSHQAELELLSYDDGGSSPYVGRDLISNLARVMSSYGSIVVIGGAPSPNIHLDHDPPVLLQNLIWVECADDSWRSLVDRLSEECRLIFVIPETTEGLRYELNLLRNQKRLDKTLVLMAAIGTGIVPHARVDRWITIRAELLSSGLKLPQYDSSGFLYLPNDDLSIRRGRRLGGNGTSELRAAIESLLPSFPSRTPLSKSMKHIETVENTMLTGWPAHQSPHPTSDG